MSMETPQPEKNEIQAQSFEQEMSSIEGSLQSLIDNSTADYEKQVENIQNTLEALETKYETNEKILAGLKLIERKISGIAIAIGGVLTLLLTEKTPGVAIGATGLSLVALSIYGEPKLEKRATQITKDIEELITTSRELTSTYLQRGGAEYTPSGRLDVTNEQVEKARGEMDKELE